MYESHHFLPDDPCAIKTCEDPDGQSVILIRKLMYESPHFLPDDPCAKTECEDPDPDFKCPADSFRLPSIPSQTQISNVRQTASGYQAFLRQMAVVLYSRGKYLSFSITCSYLCLFVSRFCLFFRLLMHNYRLFWCGLYYMILT
jgi:hypothetical protein